jgi:deazaflavin-dependent oxidoreductase (nitroreductase family)
MRFARRLALVNRAVVNPVQRLYAGHLPAHALIEHRGRRTGTAFRTPVLAHRRGDRLNVVAYYGTDSDWIRNVIAAGGCTAVRHGKRLSLGAPEVLTGDAAKHAVPRLIRPFSRNRSVLSLAIREGG